LSDLTFQTLSPPFIWPEMTLEPLGEYFERTFVLMTIKFTRAKNNSGSFTKDRKVCDLAGVIAVDSFRSDAAV